MVLVHICVINKALKKLVKVTKLHEVILSDGNIKRVTHNSCVVLNGQIKLGNVLYILEFKYNLLSIGQLTKDTEIEVIF